MGHKGETGGYFLHCVDQVLTKLFPEDEEIINFNQ